MRRKKGDQAEWEEDNTAAMGRRVSKEGHCMASVAFPWLQGGAASVWELVTQGLGVATLFFLKIPNYPPPCS